MKTILEINQSKVPLVRKDKSLNKYDKIILFPDKNEKVKNAFEKLGFPDISKHNG